MSSILTNNSSMVALSTLRNINKQLGEVQGNISTGKKIASAKDNAAVWSVSAVMTSDVTGFKAITDSLSLGQSTLNVARTGAETVNQLLDELKGRIVAAQSDNVDRGKIQADAAELRNNIGATVEASQFNGLNMLKADVNDPTVEVLGSLDRDSAGNVTVANIDVDRATLEGGTAANALVRTTASAADAAAVNVGLTIDAATSYAAGEKIALSLTGTNGNGIIMSYTVTQADLDSADASSQDFMAQKVMTAFANQLTASADAFDGATTAALTAPVDAAAANAANETAIENRLAASADRLFQADAADITLAAAGVVQFQSNLAPAARTVGVTIQAAEGGGLTELALVDVSTKAGAAAALSAIEGLTQTSINAAAAFGSSGKRVDIQMDFLKDLTDSLTAGIGSLVDADMEETSARLQALQVQQQLGVQALSIANQQPQTLLSLFR